jgi:hypothetical protein
MAHPWRSELVGVAPWLVLAGRLEQPSWGRIDPWAEASGRIAGVPF